MTASRFQTFPVLMYHKVGEPNDRFLNVPTDRFARQMRLMLHLGYTPVPFARIVHLLYTKPPISQRFFAVTFDDGYQNVADHAAPILHRLQIPATVFVVSSGVGKTNVWDAAEGAALLPLMDWQMLVRLQAEGWEIAGHTATHPHLDALSEAEALRDIRTGREEIAARTGSVPETFCYPFGHYHPDTPEIVRKAGYRGACTTRSGLATFASNPYLLPRLKPGYRDGALGLLYRLQIRPHLPTLRKKRRSEFRI